MKKKIEERLCRQWPDRTDDEQARRESERAERAAGTAAHHACCDSEHSETCEADERVFPQNMADTAEVGQ